MWTMTQKLAAASTRLLSRRQRASEEHNEEVSIPSVQVTRSARAQETSPNVPNVNTNFHDCDLPFLYALGRRWAWPAIPFRCQTHPEEADAAFRDHTGATVMHWVCFGNPPLEPVAALLQACPQLASTVNNEGQLPLHVACAYRASFAVIQAILQTYREGAGAARSSGSYPLHLLCDYGCAVETVRILLETDAGARTVTYHDRTFRRKPLLILNARRSMEKFHGDMYLLRHERIKQRQRAMAGRERPETLADQEDERRLQETLALCHATPFWQKACLLIQTEYRGAVPAEEDITSQIVHACVGIENCPSSLLEFALLLYPEELLEPDEEGRLPLHIACSNAGTTLESDVLYACPDAARVLDGEGNSPLRLAIDNGNTWSRGLCQLIATHPVGLENLDLDDSLYPILWSRLSRTPHGGTTSLYESVRSKPNLFIRQ